MFDWPVVEFVEFIWCVGVADGVGVGVGTGIGVCDVEWDTLLPCR